MAEMPGMIRPDLQALPQVRDRMTFLYLELAQACGQMLDGTFPRTRGGDPGGFTHGGSIAGFSPHTRGCSQMQEQAGKYWVLFPAHAGVIPAVRCCRAGKTAFPRTRGGDPKEFRAKIDQYDFSPHTRG